MVHYELKGFHSESSRFLWEGLLFGDDGIWLLGGET